MEQRRRKRHLYALIERLETKLRNLMALPVTGDPAGDLPENEAKIQDIAATLEEKKLAAAARWGTRWMAESLADDRLIYGDTTSSWKMMRMTMFPKHRSHRLARLGLPEKFEMSRWKRRRLAGTPRSTLPRPRRRSLPRQQALLPQPRRKG
jgi:hypothetical protein